MATYYTENAILSYLDSTKENVRITTIDSKSEYPDYIITHFDTLTGEPTQMEFITAHFVGWNIGYKHNRYTKRVPKTKKEYIVHIGRKALLSFDEWSMVIDEVKRLEAYWK